MAHRCRTLIVAFVAIVVTSPAVALAQVSVPSSQTHRPAEHFGIGGAAGLGVPGSIGVIRASLPICARAGFDIDFGRVVRHDAVYAAQVRALRRARGQTGRSNYFILGAVHIDVTHRTEIRWPDGRVTVQVTPANGWSPQIGYGWDWLSVRGVRAGLELSTGGTENAGPRIFVKTFVLWGPALR